MFYAHQSQDQHNLLTSHLIRQALRFEFYQNLQQLLALQLGFAHTVLLYRTQKLESHQNLPQAGLVANHLI